MVGALVLFFLLTREIPYPFYNVDSVFIPPRESVWLFSQYISDLTARDMYSPIYDRDFPRVPADVKKRQLIKKEFLFAWRHYKKRCWGKDEYNPVSQTCSNKLHAGLTIVDSLTSLLVMGLDDEFRDARWFIRDSFRPSGSWSLFEFNIRFIGSFLSTYEITGDRLFLDKAVECADAIYPLIRENGFYGSNLQLKTVNGTINATGGSGDVLLAEVGTYQLEFLKLTELTGDLKYAAIALNVYKEIWRKNYHSVLVSDVWGHNNTVHVGGFGSATDSYFEYIIKSYLMTGGHSPVILRQHEHLMKEIKQRLHFTTYHQHIHGLGINRNGTIEGTMDHLSMFMPGTIEVGTVGKNANRDDDHRLAAQLVDGLYTMQQASRAKVMAESYSLNINNPNVSDIQIKEDVYKLRPEAIESIYVLWKFTGEQIYRDYAWSMFQGIYRSCRGVKGYSRVTKLNATKFQRGDIMESFFMAETLKYLYLTFSPSWIVSPGEWVFNTEAHPFRIWSNESSTNWNDLIEMKTLENHIIQNRGQ